MIPQHGKRFHVLIKIFESANAGDEDQTTSFKTNFIISLGLETLTPVATQQIERGGEILPAWGSDNMALNSLVLFLLHL